MKKETAQSEKKEATGTHFITISKEQAKALFDSGWWKTKTPAEIVKFQLFTKRLCCPWEVFHEATEKALGRSVWPHEFAFPESLQSEFLGGKPAPTFQEILDLLPENKVVVVCQR